MMNKYRFGFDIAGLILFLLLMLPNIIWFAIPAPNDVLRVESATPIVDTIASVFQILTVASLCFVINKERSRLTLSPLVIATIACILIYYVGWTLYYSGNVSAVVILMLTIPPCTAFILFSVDRKNIPACVFATLFAVCQLVFAIRNHL